MNINAKKTTPDYKKIYTEMILDKYPHHLSKCHSILDKNELSIMDIIRLNRLISSNNSCHTNQKYKSYDRNTIFEILDYQKKHNLNNISTARHFNISRNTLTTWKKRFLI